MVTIQQDSKTNELSSLLAKYGSTSMDFNIKAITEDINRLKEELNKENLSRFNNKKIEKKNLNNIIDYLERIIRKSDKGAINVNWVVDKHIIKSYPIEMKSIPEYRIDTTDYINLQSEKIVYLDYSELADIIAFEIMYRDLDETHKSIEDKLSDIGIISVTDSKILTKHFSESPYKLSKILHISDSAYLKSGNEKIVDYFGNKEFKADGYREVVSNSCLSAMSIIVESLLKKQCTNLKFKICGVFETGIYLMIDRELNKYSKEMLLESVYIRTFGRKLEVKPKIQLY